MGISTNASKLIQNSIDTWWRVNRLSLVATQLFNFTSHDFTVHWCIQRTTWSDLDTRRLATTEEILWLGIGQKNNHICETESEEKTFTLLCRRSSCNEHKRNTIPSRELFYWINAVIYLRAKFCSGNINIYLHFMSSLLIDMTQVLQILPQVRPGPTYST